MAAIATRRGVTLSVITTYRAPLDVYVTYADISKARRLLGFNPTVSVQEGVKRFWQWYQAEQQGLAGA